MLAPLGIPDLFVHLQLDIIGTVLHEVLIKHFDARIKRVKPWLRVRHLDQAQEKVHLHLAQNQIDGFRFSPLAHRTALHDPLPSQVEIRSLVERSFIQTIKPVQNLVLHYESLSRSKPTFDIHSEQIPLALGLLLRPLFVDVVLLDQSVHHSQPLAAVPRGEVGPARVV